MHEGRDVTKFTNISYTFFDSRGKKLSLVACDIRENDTRKNIES